MAYRPRRRRSYGSRSSYRSRGYSGRSYRARRRPRRSRASSQRIVIQVVGGGATVPASPVSIGMKSRRVVRSRY